MTNVMKFVAILTLLTIQSALPTTVFAFGNTSAPVHLTVTFETFHNPNSPEEPYTMAVIRPRVKTEATNLDNHLLANRLLSTANDWFFDQLLTRYKHAPQEELEAKLLPMKSKGIHLTDQSSFIIVFKGGDLRKPVGTLWFYYPDANGKVELQAELDSDFWQYPVPETKTKPYPQFVLKDGVAVGVEEARESTGGVVEAKRLAIDPKEPRELLTAMLARGESYDRLSSQPIRDKDNRLVRPSEYPVRCNHALIPVYRRLGLEEVPNHPINKANEDNVMRIDRSTYVLRISMMLEAARRGGWKIQFKKSNPELSKQTETNVRMNMCRNVFAK